jgi:hypothetical protein
MKETLTNFVDVGNQFKVIASSPLCHMHLKTCEYIPLNCILTKSNYYPCPWTIHSVKVIDASKFFVEIFAMEVV